MIALEVMQLTGKALFLPSHHINFLNAFVGVMYLFRLKGNSLGLTKCVDVGESQVR